MAPAGEKALYKLIKSGHYTAADLETIAKNHPPQWVAAGTLAALLLAQAGNTSDRTIDLFRRLLDQPVDPAADAFLQKYLSVGMDIPLAPGVTASLPVSRDLLGLALAELLQQRGEVDFAIDVVERLDPSAHAAVSLAELYAEAGRTREIVDLTNGIRNTDDGSALLLTYRGIAFARDGLFEASREAFKEALKSKKRPPEIRHLALRQRAEAYAAEGKKALARKDLERILAEDSTVPGIRERIAELTG
ncbi:MAG: hypothetical protein KY456_15730 [Chloroflexi bacterium]|nr:hypothetical protein [Chloroflexota bacterium]